MIGSPSPHSKYRPEIDGLRAVAVLPVILFHAKIGMFSGGFVGVDIFFVISGFLITNIIYQGIKSGNFSLVSFYERRARRILPAMFFVSIVCLPFAWFWMLPSEFRGFSKSLIAVNTYTSNMHFMFGSGYFSPANEFKPLLHTWTLAVEEQFYVLFPIFLIICASLNRRILLALLIALVMGSFILAEIGSNIHPRANFYLLPTRAWELGVGSVLAVVFGQYRGEINIWVSQIASCVGLALILYAVFVFDKSVPFPSRWTTVPILGAAMIIVFAAPTTLVGRVLSFKPVVGLGLISYSAYLWHWPLFSFTRIRIGSELSNYVVFSLVVLTIFLAYLSWKFIEGPFRNRKMFNQKQIFMWAGVISVCLILFGVFAPTQEALRSGHLKSVDRHLSANFGLSGTCQGERSFLPACTTSDTPEIVVWGDSFAMHLVPGILISRPEVELTQLTMGACGPFFDVAPIGPPSYNKHWANKCVGFNEKVRVYIEETPSIKYVVLASPFAGYLHPESKIYFQGRIIPSEYDLVLERFKATLKWLVDNGVHPVVFAPPPTNGEDIGYCLARNSWFQSTLSVCDIRVEDDENETRDVKAFLREIDAEYDVIWIHNFLCNDDKCRVEEDGVFMYRDGWHLSIEGSRYIGKNLGFYDVITKGKKD